MLLSPIFWKLDISIQDYEVQGGTKEDLNRDALEAAKDDAWEAQIWNRPELVGCVCYKQKSGNCSKIVA